MMLKKIANFIGYEIVWFISILAAAKQQAWIGLLVSVIFFLFYLVFTTARRQKIKRIILIVCLGCVVDSVENYYGVLHFFANPWQPFCTPWILAIWLMFATTLHSSLAWLQQREWLAAILGLVLGPASYYAGVRLHALSMPNLPVALLTLGIVWMVLFPLLLRLAAPANLRSAV